jgi:hypothetical protein
MQPSIGRIVHFISEQDGGHQAAIVTRVWSDTCVNVTVFGDDAVQYFSSVNLDTTETPARRSWHWPEQVK